MEPLANPLVLLESPRLVGVHSGCTNTFEFCIPCAMPETNIDAQASTGLGYSAIWIVQRNSEGSDQDLLSRDLDRDKIPMQIPASTTATEHANTCATIEETETLFSEDKSCQGHACTYSPYSHQTASTPIQHIFTWNSHIIGKA